MKHEELVEKAKTDLGDALTSAEVVLGDAVLHTTPESWRQVAEYLKNDPAMECNYLSQTTGVDYLEEDREPRFEAVYELHSLTQNHTVRVRVGLDEDEPKVPTVSDLWKGALFPEREMFDMFGFEITGHPDLRRLIMPDDWEGHPLKKDYPLVWEDIAFSHNADHKAELVKSKPEYETED
ncbi:MAG: NADH-quinone oxidoreductase subunit C [Nitrospina sp.]|nr:NADH-quinone oxidoreductase subunit C [Nitrospina sp.]